MTIITWPSIFAFRSVNIWFYIFRCPCVGYLNIYKYYILVLEMTPLYLCNTHICLLLQSCFKVNFVRYNSSYSGFLLVSIWMKTFSLCLLISKSESFWAAQTRVFFFFFLISLAILCVLTWEFSLLRFKVIIDSYVLITTFC